MDKLQKECSVIVYGDLGRSPRMQNHVFELLQNNYKVNFLGYVENPIRIDIAQNPNLIVQDLTISIVKRLKNLPKIFYLLYAFLRIVLETLSLLYILIFRLPYQEFLLVQNPPSIPVLACCYAVKIIRGSLFVIDFHNYGYTILGLNINNPRIVSLARTYERFFGGRADISFCVSNAMQIDLQQQWGIKKKYNGKWLPQVLYDKANIDMFRPFKDLQEKHEFLLQMNLQWSGALSSQSTLFTFKEGNVVRYVDERPVFIVSSTSWTKDEDFDLFLEALEAYEECAKHSEKRLPRLFVAITGKGPEKERFRQIFKQRESDWRFIRIVQLWLQPQDYPKLLACADIGVCLHYSSSGVDLPMKVVDMFGAGIPVFAKNYKAQFLIILYEIYKSIGELVQHNQNGFLFDTSQDLFEQMLNLFQCFPKNTQVLQAMTERVKKFRSDTFHREWVNKALPLLQKKLKQS